MDNCPCVSVFVSPCIALSLLFFFDCLSVCLSLSVCLCLCLRLSLPFFETQLVTGPTVI